MERRGRQDAATDQAPASAPARAHLVGLDDPGMPGLAHWLVQRGREVSGSASSPASVERLRALGVRVHAGHGPGPRGGSGALIYAPGTPRLHPERLTATRDDREQGSALDWLNRLLGPGVGVVVAGRRGSGAASAMIAWTLARAGLDPSLLLARAVAQLGGWARVGKGPHSVVEAVELDGELGPAAPRMALVLDLEDDPRPEGLRRFLASVPDEGAILALAPNPAIEDAVRGLTPVVEWLALDRVADWWGADLREDRGRYRFRAFHRGRFVVEVRLQVPGRRNVVSALAAVAVCRRLGLPAREIKESLEEFLGLSRDFESRGSYRGVTLVDDASPDATAVAEALALCRQVFGRRRLCAVLAVPGGPVAPDALRTYVSALAVADQVFLTVEEPATEPPEPETWRIAAAGSRTCWRWLARRDDVIAELDRSLQPGDVLLTLGAGAVGTIADAFIRRLPRDHQGR